MVSSPSYDPRLMVGRQRSKNHRLLSQDVWKPLLNRSIMGLYPPGSTFKTSQGLTFLSEGVITPTTQYPCGHGFNFRGLHVGCHGHAAPLPLVPALSTSCNGFFCWGLYYMINQNISKYGSVQKAMDTWRDYMVSMGFGYKLGIDLPGEKLYRSGRGVAHSFTDSQSGSHYRQQRLLLRASCGAKGAG